MHSVVMQIHTKLAKCVFALCDPFESQINRFSGTVEK